MPEASGVTDQPTLPQRLWTHNDSGEPALFMLDARGRVTGRIQLSGATVVDWEAVVAGPCPTGRASMSLTSATTTPGATASRSID